MPYLNYLVCEVCGSSVPMDLDYVATIESYIADGRKTTTLDDRNFIWDYLIYTCLSCRRKFRYTYRDVEQRVREYLSSISEKRKREVEEMAEAQQDEQARRSGYFFVAKSKEVAERIKSMYSK